MISFRWFGISCFEIRNSETIVTDPHNGASIGLKKPEVKGDIVLVTHQHFDHASGKDLASKKETEIIEKSGKQKVRGVEIEGIPYYREDTGKNIFFKFTLNEFKICHLGDLGYDLSRKEVDKIKPVDIALVPVGGTGGHEGQEAVQVVEELEPKIIIPHHYAVEGMALFISSEKEFLQLAKDKGWEIKERREAKIDSLPERSKIIKLTCQTT